jgi:hypothetical protein
LKCVAARQGQVEVQCKTTTAFDDVTMYVIIQTVLVWWGSDSRMTDPVGFQYNMNNHSAQFELDNS